MTDNDPKTDSLDIITLSFKLPPFTLSSPRVWFRQIKAVFSTSRITSERTRYSYMVQILPFDVAVDVDDPLDPIPTNDPYHQLKNFVIQRMAKSVNRMLRELFIQVELGDQTSSQLMCHMRSFLAGSHINDDTFRQIWLDKLSVPMQQVLSMLDISISLGRVANHAERINHTTEKRPRQPVTATVAAVQSRPSDKTSGLRFLVDIGAEINVIPPPRRHHLRPSQFSLQVANSTTINTYGQRPLTLDIGLRGRFQWVFVQADVKSPIIGADFLTHFGLAVDLKHRKLIDTTTTFFTIGIAASEPSVSIHLTVQSSPFADILKDYSSLTKPCQFTEEAKPNRYSPREVRHLNYISQFTADIRYVRGSDNVVANELSRPDINTLTSDFDLAKLADLQSGEKFIDDLRSTTTLQLRDAPLPASPGTILCDWSTGTPRPVVPLSYRKTVFDHFHSLSYPAIRASRKLIAARFIWPKMNSDIVFWIRQCLSCQKNKVHRHTFSPPSTFAVPDVRFHHVHLDLVGPPPPSRGYTHILTAVDRFTPWPIAVPISDTSAENTIMVFLTQWISTFGVPATLTTDRGSQFQSSLFREFTRMLACAHITTTAYHPASNGLVERLHRQLKSALMSQTESATWSVNPPLMLLGIRSSVREDIQCTAAELVYGTPLRLPGEFVQPSTTTTYIPSTFVQQLKQRMAQLRPTPTRLTSKRVFVHKDLKSVPFVFARHEAVRKFLCPSYDGPYEVLQRMDKCYVIQKAEKNDTVSIDRLKSAYLECIPLSVVPPISSAPSPPDPPVSVPSTAPHTSSRSGRHIYFPSKLKGFSL
ncbi:hypothetical protein SprV_0200673300 [Sparganum proliferum]